MPKPINDGLTPQQRYVVRHPERVKASKDAYVKNNPKRVSQSKKNYRKTHHSELLVKGEEYRNRYPLRKKINNRKWALNKKYKISLEDYDNLLKEQDGVCKICKQSPSEQREFLDVDHNHKTGKVRGLLCHKCNVAIGLAQDNPERLRCMATYLEGEDTDDS